MGTTHWHDEDYFGSLVCGEEEAFSALEFLIDDLHVSKELTVHRFLGDAGSEDFIWSLVKFLGSRDSRVAGNAAYIIGTIAESAAGRDRVISLTESRHIEKKNILPDLVNLLSSSDDESVMNAAGTIGTLAESDEGRDWLLQESCTQKLIEKVTSLLSNENDLTASNAALVLARLTISERGCKLLLNNHYSKTILSQLIGSLGADEAGKGMNAAFAIGRLCDIPEGRAMLLSLPDSKKMLMHLGTMLCSNDTGSSKNACFAISCLASSADGHDRLMSHSLCDKMILTLVQLLNSSDLETGWFAAMTLRTFSSRPKGCIKMRELNKVVPNLQVVAMKCRHNEDMISEVEKTLEILKLLDKPSPPVITVLGPRSVHVAWSEVTTKSGLPVLYKLLEDGSNRCVYVGSDLEFTLSELSPNQTVTFRLRACVTGDESPYSESASATTEEDVPQQPSNLRLLGRTATILKIGWDPPEDCCGVIKAYHIYLDNGHVDQTTELSYIISGLKEQTTYNVGICAATCKGKGPKANIDCVTADLGDHCPSKPLLSIMGRSEINVTWNPPQVPLGRITRYDVSSNGKVFYSGTDLHCTARHLQPNTEYTFVVTVITNEGPLDSKPAKKRTAKDEYDCQRLPLYVPPQKKDDSRNDLDMVPQSSYKKRRKKLPLNSRDKPTSSTKLRVTKKLSLTNDLVTDASKLIGSGSPTVPTSDSSLSSESQSTVNHLSSTDHQSTRLRTSSLNSSTPFNTKSSSLTKTFCGTSTKSPKESFYYPHSSDECIFKTSSNKELIAAFLTNQSVNSVSSRNNPLRHHRSSVPDESDKLTRTLSNLSMVNIEPALPASLQQHRSSTFVAQRRAGINSLKNQYTTVTHGNGASFTMELPSGRLSQQSSQSRTFSTGNLPASSVKP